MPYSKKNAVRSVSKIDVIKQISIMSMSSVLYDDSVDRIYTLVTI